jgi:flagellar assembly protein FliH
MPVERWTRVAFAEGEHRLILDDPEAAALLAGIDVVSSAEVDPGGAMVEVDGGAVDTRIGRAFARAAAALRGDDDGEVAR